MLWYNNAEKTKKDVYYMAKRRMLLLELMRSDEFLALPIQSQALYVHLSVDADDDGFLCGKKRILAMLGLKEKAFTPLEQNGFVIVFPSGAAVLTHWPLCNKIPKDRYTPTRYQVEKEQLQIVHGLGYVLKKDAPAEGTQKAEPNTVPPKYKTEESKKFWEAFEANA